MTESGLWGHSSPSGGKEYIIFSSVESRESVERKLSLNSIDYKHMKGSYNGELEDVWIVGQDDYSNFFAIFRDLTFGQETILWLGKCTERDTRPAELVWIEKDNETEKLGEMHSVSREYAKMQPSWTYDYEFNTYYVAEKKDATSIEEFTTAAA